MANGLRDGRCEYTDTVFVPEPRTMRQIERTIRHVAKQIRREEPLDARSVSALAKLLNAYDKLIDSAEAEEDDSGSEYYDRMEQSALDELKLRRKAKSLEND